MYNLNMGAISRWLDVEVGTADINLNTLPSNIALVDLNNDNEVKLVVGDMGKEQGAQLKIFKGTMQISDMVLPDLPLGVVSFYASETMPKAPPLIAIAFDSCIHIYRHLKFFYKYQLPTIEINEQEMEIWKQLKDPVNHNEASLLGLSKSLYSLSHNLCSQSRSFLQMTIDEKLEFVATTDLPKKIIIHISCITTLKMNSTDKYGVSCLVIGTEEGDVVVLDPHTFTKLIKGKKQWWISLEHRPVAMCQVPVLHLGITLVAVALSSGHLNLYDGKVKRDSMFVRDIASVIKFGQLGQEEHVLTIVTANGNLMLKILKRTADFNEHAAGVEPTAIATTGQKPWLIPKKSKLFLEQSMRERENAAAMNHTFQHELDRLRLTAAKTLLEVYTKSDNAMGIGALEPVRLAAEVQGLGPVFRMTLIIENTSKDKAVVGLSVLFHTQGTSYKVNNPYIKIPLLTLGSRLKFPTKVEEIFSDNINPDVFFRTVTGQAEGSLIKILLLKEGKSNPVLAATVQMPATDPMMVPFEKIQATSDFNELAVN